MGKMIDKGNYDGDHSTMGMKTVFAMIVTTALCAGCGRMGAVTPPRHSKFIGAHDAGEHLRDVANASGYAVGQVARSYSNEDTTAEKCFSISIKGDRKIREKLLREYKDFVANEMKTAGVDFNGGSFNAVGTSSGFAFHYHGKELKGIISVSSEVGLDGYITINVNLYEHSCAPAQAE